MARKGYDFAGMDLEFVSGLAIGLITNYLYDQIVKGAYAIKPDASAVTIREFEQADGAKVIVIAKA